MALTSTADVRTELAEPSEPVAEVPNRFEQIPGSLAGGASAPFVFTTALTGSNSLGITAPGVYPVMVNVNGAVVLPAGPLEARIGELHLLVTVLSVPGGTTGGTGPAPAGSPTPFNFIWPMVDVPHLGVDGVFSTTTAHRDLPRGPARPAPDQPVRGVGPRAAGGRPHPGRRSATAGRAGSDDGPVSGRRATRGGPAARRRHRAGAGPGTGRRVGDPDRRRRGRRHPRAGDRTGRHAGHGAGRDSRDHHPAGGADEAARPR